MTTMEATSNNLLHEFRELSSFRAARGLVVSLTFGFDPTSPITGDDVAMRLAALIDQAKRSSEEAVGRLGHAERLALAQDVARIRDSVLNGLGPASIACFADGPDHLWRELEIQGPLPDLVRVGHAPYLVPLVSAPAVEHAFVASVGREQGEIYELRSGRLAKVVDLYEQQPRRHRDGQAWIQPSLERHIDELARKHLAECAATVERFLQSPRAARLILAGEQEHTSTLAGMLSKQARAQIAGTIHPEAHAGSTELMQLILPVLERRADEDERGVVERWNTAVGRAKGGVQGWQDTLAAASDGQIELLLFRESATRPAFECPACGRASAAGGSCPVDGQRLAPFPDGLDLAIRQTLAHGGFVRAVRRHPELSEVGALLRY